MISRLKALALFLPLFSLLVLCTSVASAQNANPARPGTLNYIEGPTTIDGQSLTPQAIGSTELDPGQVLATGQGKAEMLLTPGIFFRLDDNSAAKMVSPDLTNTVVDLEKGRATVEVDQIFPQNDIHIVENGIPTQLLKTGLYEFDADRGAVRVFEGKAAVLDRNHKFVTVNSHHELALSEGASLKAQDFDTHAAHDDLYNWSSLRSQYLAQANSQIAGGYAGAAGFAPGWYWDPYFSGYTFIGMYPFWSPFGWGFYSPWAFYGGGFYGRGFYGHGFYGHGGYGGGFGGGGFHGGGGGGGHR
jgi:hypothetical protein